MGRGNARLIAWEGDKTVTFTVEDALLSPIGYSILSGAGLFKNYSNGTEVPDVHFHMSTAATIDKNGKVDLGAAIATLGKNDATGKNRGEICLDDAPIFVMKLDKTGDITGELISENISLGDSEEFGTNQVLIFETTKNENVMIDYYVDLPGANVYEADITADTFAGYYYVEADTLFRRQADGKDLPANLTFPNVKLQSNFTITMAGSGDPSTFTFTFDAFPGYTYFDKTKKVLSVLQVVDDSQVADKNGKPVMLHEEGDENGIMAIDSATNYPKN